MNWVGVLIRPLDPLFFRGGRPFGEGLRAESGLPSPQVFAGLIRTLLLEGSGADFAAMRNHRDLQQAFHAAGAPWVGQVKCRGPWFAEIRDGSIWPMVAAPADLRIDEAGEPCTLRPSARCVPGWTPPQEGMAPLWNGGRRAGKEIPEYLTFEGLRRYLSEESLTKQHLRSSDVLFDWEERTGVGIDAATFAHIEGLLYSTKSLRLREGIAFYGEVELPEGRESLLRKLTTWGGEQRVAAIEPVDPVRWPAHNSDRTTVLLITPGIFPGGWRPDGFGPDHLRGAAVKGPFTVSGWDLARGGPKSARFGVDAGTVYFLADGTPTGDQLVASREDEALGYGVIVKGSWNYAE